MNQYKIEKYLSKLENCDFIEKQNIYRSKIQKYSSLKGGIGSTNVLIVFDTSLIKDTQLEKIMNESENKPINVDLMKKSDLEKILSKNAYFIEEKKQTASLFGESYFGDSLDKAKQKISSIDINVLKSDDIKKAGAELKSIETIFNSVDKLLSNSSGVLLKKLVEIQKINSNYSELLNSIQDKNLPVVTECTSTILNLTSGIISNIEERNSKIMSLNEKLKSEKTDFLQKMTDINQEIDVLISLNQKTTELEKEYNNAIKTYNSCVNPESEVKLSTKYSVINYEQLIQEIREQVQNKMNLDGYMLCVMNTIGANKLIKIGKF